MTVARVQAIASHLPWRLSDYTYSPTVIIAILECVVLLYLALAHAKHDDVLTHERLPIPTTWIRGFRLVWQVLWIAWALLYAVVAVKAWLQFAKPSSFSHYEVLFSVFIDAGSNIVTVLISSDTSRCMRTGFWEKGGLNIGQIFARFLPLILVLLLSFVGVEVLCATLLDNDAEVHTALKVCSAVAGVISGAAICLFVGRLESKFVSPPKRVVVALYGYAVTQPFIALWSVSDDIQTVTVAVWFAFKLLFFLSVFWFLKSGRGLFYFAKMTTLNASVSKDWEQFYLDYFDAGSTGPAPAATAEVATPEVPVEIKYDVFLSAPMASLSESKRNHFEQRIAVVRAALEKLKLSVYRAGSTPGDALPDAALRTDTAALRESRFFLLLGTTRFQPARCSRAESLSNARCRC